MKTASAVIRDRRSVRAFLPTPLSSDCLTEIFALAAAAPSNCNTQPWQVEVVGGAARDRLSTAMLRAAHDQQYTLDFEFDETLYAGVYGERRRAQGALYHEALGISRLDMESRQAAILRNLTFFGAPHVAFLFMPAFGGHRVAADLGMYAQTLLLALESQGAAGCPQTILGFFADLVRQELGVGEDLKLLFGISFGLADSSAPQNSFRMPRAPLAQTTRFHD